MGLLGTVLVLLAGHVLVSGSVTGNEKRNSIEDDEYGEPLFLTKFLDSGDIAKGREMSRTGPLPNAPEIESYSGFFTVKKKYNSNIFFWFFPAMNQDKKAPVLLWLQGGPGTSGLFGLFVEHGPYVVNPNMSLGIKQYHWAKNFNIIYVDNPVGTGFSFTGDLQGFAKSQDDIDENMYDFLQQFFLIFPDYQKNEFYIAGEDYAGKYVPSLAYKIHTVGPSSGINLKGIAIGNGFCDPESMMDYGDYLYNIGLVDEMQANEMKNLSSYIVSYIRNKEYFDAVDKWDKLIMLFPMFPKDSLYKNFTGLNNYNNFMMSSTPRDFKYYSSYIEKPEFRKAIHVGNLTFHNGEMCINHLLLDIMQSVKTKVAVIMENYRVLVYSGQLDVIVPYPSTLSFLKSIDWKYADEYREAKRHFWILTGTDKIVGYVHTVRDFQEVLVRDGGHVLPYDQPWLAYDMISRFVKNKPI